MKRDCEKYNTYIKNLYYELIKNDYLQCISNPNKQLKTQTLRQTSKTKPTHKSKQTQNPLNIDIVLEGGGFGGAYEVGVMLFLRFLENKKHINICRISGVSIGSIVGLLYLTNKLHYYDKYYKKIREDWYKNLEMKSLSIFIKKIVYSLTDEAFENIRENKLFVSYYNLQSKQHITKSIFINKDDLYMTIMKSCHMPLLKSKNLTYTDDSNNNFIDGLYPYIFTKKDRDDNKILYVSINQIQKLRNCVDTRNETDCFSRILHGILHCFDLFKYNKPNEYCSFLDEWSLFDMTYYRTKQMLLFVFMYSIYFINSISKKIYPYIERSIILNTIYTIIRNYIDDIMYYFLI